MKEILGKTMPNLKGVTCSLQRRKRKVAAPVVRELNWPLPRVAAHVISLVPNRSVSGPPLAA
jgi:hypothetical protein